MIRKSTFEKFYNTKKFLFLFRTYIYLVSKSVKCLFWQIFNEIIDNQDLYRKKRPLKSFLNKKFLYFYLKDFVFNKYICKMYKLYNDLQCDAIRWEQFLRRCRLGYL